MNFLEIRAECPTISEMAVNALSSQNHSFPAYLCEVAVLGFIAKN